MALGDVLVGQEVKDVASYLPSLWELSLRARDDVKVTHIIIVILALCSEKNLTSHLT